MPTCKEHESYCGLVRWERDDAQCPACLMYHEALKFRCAEIGMKARDARWQAVVKAVGKLAYHHDEQENILQFITVCAAMREGTLEAIEKALESR